MISNNTILSYLWRMFQSKGAGAPSTENLFGSPLSSSLGTSSPATQERRRVKVKTPQSTKKGSEDFGFKEETDLINALTIHLQDLKQQLSALDSVQIHFRVNLHKRLHGFCIITASNI